MRKEAQVPEQYSQFFLSWAESRRVLSNAETVELLCGETWFIRLTLVADSAARHIFPKVGPILTCSHLLVIQGLDVPLFSRSHDHYLVDEVI